MLTIATAVAYTVLLHLSGQPQPVNTWDSNGWTTGSDITSCYIRRSGLCQTSPLTEAEKAEDALYKQTDDLMTELGNRRDLAAADVLYLGEMAKRRFFMDADNYKQLFEDLQGIKKRADAASSRITVNGFSNDFDAATPRAADETDGKPSEKCDWTCNCHNEQGNCIIPVAITEPAEPIDVPAVQLGTQHVKYGQFNVPRDWCQHYGEVLTLNKHGDGTCFHYKCTETSRILLPPDGNGKYWCHKVQN